jgi:hypothetical protein
MKTLIFLIAVFMSVSAAGQDALDTIRYSAGRGELKFYTQNREIRFLELSKLVKEDAAANPYLKKAKMYRNMNGIFVGVGIISLSYGVLFGLKEAIENEDGSPALSGLIAGTLVGGAFLVLSIPPGKAYKLNARRAVDIYNRNLAGPPETTMSYYLGLSPNGLTLSLRF